MTERLVLQEHFNQISNFINTNFDNWFNNSFSRGDLITHCIKESAGYEYDIETIKEAVDDAIKELLKRGYIKSSGNKYIAIKKLSKNNRICIFSELKDIDINKYSYILKYTLENFEHMEEPTLTD